jgi:hypothetical protein
MFILEEAPWTWGGAQVLDAPSLSTQEKQKLAHKKRGFLLLWPSRVIILMPRA